jgi:hypothetical protein
MARNQLSQAQRTQNNPLVLGNFNSTTIRYLHGSLGPQNKVIGRADTNQTSNGGYGGGTYNHWFQVNILSPAWIIITKGPPRPKYIQVSVYDLNKTPIQGEAIFDADSVQVPTGSTVYVPYLNTVMSAPSDLYNQFSNLRLDRGDERYYPLNAGSYLICVSTTRNEPLAYNLAVVVEFTTTEGFFELEDDDGSVFLLETDIATSTTEFVSSPITTNRTIPADPTALNAYSSFNVQINSGVTVTVTANATWLIGGEIPVEQQDLYKIVLEPGNDAYWDTIHDHSLSEWVDSWERDHQDTEPFPDLLIPLTNRP